MTNKELLSKLVLDKIKLEISKSNIEEKITILDEHIKDIADKIEDQEI
jgi:hypothetical protein